MVGGSNRIAYACIRYILSCNKLSPKLLPENNKYLLSHISLRVMNLVFGLVGCFGSGFLIKLQSRCWPGLESLKPWLDSSASKMTHLCLLAENLSQSLHGLHDLSQELLEHPGDMAAGFAQGKWSKREQEGSCSAFYELVLEITHHGFYIILFISAKSPNPV